MEKHSMLIFRIGQDVLLAYLGFLGRSGKNISAGMSIIGLVIRYKKK